MNSLNFLVIRLLLYAIFSLLRLLFLKSDFPPSADTGPGRSNACLTVVGRVLECVARDGQQFEHFT